MMTDPILAARPLPKGTDGNRVPMWVQVEGGLHRIGDQAPYFSLTYTMHRRGFRDQCQSGGAGHDTIRRYFGPRFDDLAALHLSSIDGAPMHAEANGWYWLGQDDMAALARHCRITIPEAEYIRHQVGHYDGAAAREEWGRIMEAMRPRWKNEADAAIAHHNLKEYGR